MRAGAALLFSFRIDRIEKIYFPLFVPNHRLKVTIGQHHVRVPGKLKPKVTKAKEKLHAIAFVRADPRSVRLWSGFRCNGCSRPSTTVRRPAVFASGPAAGRSGARGASPSCCPNTPAQIWRLGFQR